jgi:hypothetical protein
LACGVADPSASSEADLGDIAQFRRGHHPRPDGGSGGATGGSTGTSGTGGSSASTGTGGGDADCEVCTKANACCNVVGGGPLCTFSSATCSTYGANARAGYLSACRMLLNTAFSAWNSKPPPACF